MRLERVIVYFAHIYRLFVQCIIFAVQFYVYVDDFVQIPLLQFELCSQIEGVYRPR